MVLAADVDVDELGLAAVAVRGDDEAAGDLVGDLGAIVAAHEVQAEVDARGAARRCEQGAVVDVEDVGVDVDERERPREPIGVAPVRRRAAAVEQAGGGEHEHPRADRHDSRAALVRATERDEQRLGRALGGVPPARAARSSLLGRAGAGRSRRASVNAAGHPQRRRVER